MQGIRTTEYDICKRFITWLDITEYLCHKCPWISFVCRNHNPVVSSFMTNIRLHNNKIGVTCGAGTEYPSGAPEFTPDFFSGVRVT